jgi:hypothetical protein
MPILSEKELIDLTGARRPAEQRRRLDQAGIRYVTRIDGRPSTTWEAVNAVLCREQQKSSGPNIEAMRKAGIAK